MIAEESRLSGDVPAEMLEVLPSGEEGGVLSASSDSAEEESANSFSTSLGPPDPSFPWTLVFARAKLTGLIFGIKRL